MELNIIFILASIIGMAAKLKQKNNSLKDLAGKGNLEFPGVWQFLIQNKKAIIWNVVAMIAFQLFAGNALKNIILNSSNTPEPFLGGWVPIARRDVVTAVITVIYLSFAYMGQDYLFSGLSRTSKEIRKAIDYKTTIADEATGTTNEPTPVK